MLTSLPVEVVEKVLGYVDKQSRANLLIALAGDCRYRSLVPQLSKHVKLTFSVPQEENVEAGAFSVIDRFRFEGFPFALSINGDHSYYLDDPSFVRGLRELTITAPFFIPSDLTSLRKLTVLEATEDFDLDFTVFPLLEEVEVAFTDICQPKRVRLGELVSRLKLKEVCGEIEWFPKDPTAFIVEKCYLANLGEVLARVWPSIKIVEIKETCEYGEEGPAKRFFPYREEDEKVSHSGYSSSDESQSSESSVGYDRWYSAFRKRVRERDMYSTYSRRSMFLEEYDLQLPPVQGHPLLLEHFESSKVPDISKHDTPHLRHLRFEEFHSDDATLLSPMQQKQMRSIKLRDLRGVEVTNSKMEGLKEVVVACAVDGEELDAWVEKLAPDIERLDVKLLSHGVLDFDSTLKHLKLEYSYNTSSVLTFPYVQTLHLERYPHGASEKVVLDFDRLTEAKLWYGSYRNLEYKCPILQRLELLYTDNIDLNKIPSSVRYLKMVRCTFINSDEQWHFSGDYLGMKEISKIPSGEVTCNTVEIEYPDPSRGYLTGDRVRCSINKTLVLAGVRRITLSKCKERSELIPLPSSVGYVALHDSVLYQSDYFANLKNLTHIKLVGVEGVYELEIPPNIRRFEAVQLNGSLKWTSTEHLTEVRIVGDTSYLRKRCKFVHPDKTPSLRYLSLDRLPLLGIPEYDRMVKNKHYGVMRSVKEFRKHRPAKLLHIWINGEPYCMGDLGTRNDKALEETDKKRKATFDSAQPSKHARS
ncbi:hypothetical protein DICA4_E21770 [Diutina catenulata]